MLLDLLYDLCCVARPLSVVLAAALLHDVGKARAGRDHDRMGAELLRDLMPERVVWLVEHHLDLLRAPRRIRRRLRGSQRLFDLERLRTWDVGGRDPRAAVRRPEEAVAIIMAATYPGDAELEEYDGAF